MAARHKKSAKGHAAGGIVTDKKGATVAYSGGDSNVMREAKARKCGGKAMGAKAGMRLDRPGRKRGGAVGADMHPMSSAARVSAKSAVTNTDPGGS